MPSLSDIISEADGWLRKTRGKPRTPCYVPVHNRSPGWYPRDMVFSDADFLQVDQRFAAALEYAFSEGASPGCAKRCLLASNLMYHRELLLLPREARGAVSYNADVPFSLMQVSRLRLAPTGSLEVDGTYANVHSDAAGHTYARDLQTGFIELRTDWLDHNFPGWEHRLAISVELGLNASLQADVVFNRAPQQACNPGEVSLAM